MTVPDVSVGWTIKQKMKFVLRLGIYTDLQFQIRIIRRRPTCRRISHCISVTPVENEHIQLIQAYIQRLQTPI